MYANRRRIRGERGQQLMRLRGELLERPNAHLYETGGMRRTHLRGHGNILKRLLVHGGRQSGPVAAHVDGYWNATRPAGPFGRRMGFLFYSVGGIARPSNRYSLPRTRSETICGPKSPLHTSLVRYL